MTALANRTSVTLLVLFLLTACGGDDGTTDPPVTDPDTVATTVTVISGDGQTAEVGTLLPTQLGVRVTNSGGDPLVGKAITWTVESGGGSLAGPVSGTDAQGEAVNAYTLGAAPGSVSTKSVPLPSSECSSIPPPCASMMRRDVGSPRPDPAAFVVK